MCFMGLFLTFVTSNDGIYCISQLKPQGLLGHCLLLVLGGVTRLVKLVSMLTSLLSTFVSSHPVEYVSSYSNLNSNPGHILQTAHLRSVNP